MSPNLEQAQKTRERRVQQVIALAGRAGYTPAGWTSERVIDTLADGTEVKTPPRQRFIQPRSGIRMTVGLNLTFFYRIENGEPVELASFRTGDLAEIAQWLLDQARARMRN